MCCRKLIMHLTEKAPFTSGETDESIQLRLTSRRIKPFYEVLDLKFNRFQYEYTGI